MAYAQEARHQEVDTANKSVLPRYLNIAFYKSVIQHVVHPVKETLALLMIFL